MLDLGWQEFFLIAVVAVLVVGPKDLPRVIRGVTQTLRKVRGMAREFQSSIEEVAREAELDEIRKQAQDLSQVEFSNKILDSVDPDREVSKSLDETRSVIETMTSPDLVNATPTDTAVVSSTMEDGMRGKYGAVAEGPKKRSKPEPISKTKRSKSPRNTKRTGKDKVKESASSGRRATPKSKPVGSSTVTGDQPAKEG
ncbi:MAG: twin-arginine translocase subunit TatB [Rhodospirillaceae bacterium]|nr:twin-arginine translocase subunit TatB [Rhodospirillaceae bacterium]